MIEMDIDERVFGALAEQIRDMAPGMLHPLNGRVWLQRIPPAESTKGGLEIPLAAQKKHNYCVVREVADDVEIAIKPGDIVMIEAYEGQEVVYGSVEYLLVDKDQIKARID